ncbi:TPA: hypothetical protein ACX6R1_000001 [Photobacterium damselae]
MIFAIFTSVASLASIVGLIDQLYKQKEKPKTYILVVLALLLSVGSAYQWTEISSLEVRNEQLSAENKKLLEARNEAADLLNKWEHPDQFDFVSNGEFRGMVLSGMAFLESRKDIFPDTYMATKSLLLNEMKSTSNDGSWAEQRHNLKEAAETIYTTVESIAQLKSKY